MNCNFCGILNTLESNETYIGDLEFGVLLLNVNQSFKGRCLYISKQHINLENLENLESHLYLSCNKEILYVMKKLKILFNAELVNLALLGNKEKHMHWHLIPRYRNDTNKNNPPWPNKEKILNKDEFHSLILLIKNNINRGEEIDREYSVPTRS